MKVWLYLKSRIFVPTKLNESTAIWVVYFKRIKWSQLILINVLHNYWSTDKLISSNIRYFCRNTPMTSLLWRWYCTVTNSTWFCCADFVCPSLFYVFFFILWLACRNELLYCLFVYLSVLNVLALTCIWFLSSNVVILVVYFTLSYNARFAVV